MSIFGLRTIFLHSENIFDFFILQQRLFLDTPPGAFTIWSESFGTSRKNMYIPFSRISKPFGCDVPNFGSLMTWQIIEQFQVIQILTTYCLLGKRHQLCAKGVLFIFQCFEQVIQ